MRLRKRIKDYAALCGRNALRCNRCSLRDKMSEPICTACYFGYKEGFTQGFRIAKKGEKI